jgi:maltose alpha-D-glucosyltransferase/alpha-amylase
MSQWYKDAILYEVDVRSFCDASGDGIGDCLGLINKLYYLHELGVTGLIVGGWHYCRVGSDDPAGAFVDFSPRNLEQVVREAHSRDMRVISELRFDQGHDSTVVARTAFDAALRRCLDAGIDGVKIDLGSTLSELRKVGGSKPSKASGFVKATRTLIDKHDAERVVVVEAGASDNDPALFGRGDECHVAYNVGFMPHLLMALKRESLTPLKQALRRMTGIPASCRWAIFLRHNKELSLASCTDSDRREINEIYAPEPGMRFNGGIRRRLAPLFDNDRRRIELAYTLMFSLPGTPVIYYGDEIGMGDNIYLDGCIGLQTPMQWSSGRNAGFSLADSARLSVPVNAGPVYGYQMVNVEAQNRQPRSLLNWVRKLIAVRRRYAAFARGTLAFLNLRNETVLAFMRCDGEERILVVANLSGKAQSAELDLGSYAGVQPVAVLGGTGVPLMGASPYSVTLGPYECFWLLLMRPAIRSSPRSDVVASVSSGRLQQAEATAGIAGKGVLCAAHFHL